MKSIPLPVKFLVIMLVWVLIFLWLFPKEKQYDDIDTVEFYAYLADERVEGVIYFPSAQFALVQVKPYRRAYRLLVISAEDFENNMLHYALNHEKFSYVIGVVEEKASVVDAIILAACVTFILLGVFHFIEGKLGVSPSRFRGSRKNRYLSHVKFSDVIGLEKQMDDIKDIVRFLKEPKKYEEIGAVLPKGILLYGPPGVGKTHIARAIAGEAGVPFFELSAPELESKWVGEGEERIRKLFNKAKKKAPSVIYIDELDSIAMERFSEDSNNNMVGLINQLLACMDGFSKEDNVVVIASTNHIESLDKAILRNGRFDRKILIHAPDKEARRKLIEYYSQGKKLEDEICIEKLLNISAGLTGADIKTIMNEAALLTVRDDKSSISEEIIMEAFRKAAIGSEHTNSPISKSELMRIAVHEAGHAIISKHFSKSVSEISIVARGRAAGYNLRAEEDCVNHTFGELKEEIMIFLGGRAAEDVIYQKENLSIGAVDDLRKATNLVKDMFLRFSYPVEENIFVLSDNDLFNERLIDQKYPDMVQYMCERYEDTLQILASKKEQILSLTSLLLEKETLTEDEVKAFFKHDE